MADNGTVATSLLTAHTELEYCIVDVFTESVLAGNPLAVVLDTVGLETSRMQAIAREFNLSETTFVQRREADQERAEGVRVRIFTTEEELPFAGHPTLGTASVLKARAPEILQGNTIALALKVGPVPVRFEAQAGKAALFGEMTQREPDFGQELDPREIAPLLGLEADQLDMSHTPQVVSTGNPFAIVLLKNLAALERLNVHQAKATPWLREHGARWFYVLAPSGETVPAYRARMQFYGGEDPATGSAAGCAISYLVARGIVASEKRILVRQGVEIRRPSDLFLTGKNDAGKVTDIRVAGSTVLVATGRLFLP